jgi:hypothetical protein
MMYLCRYRSYTSPCGSSYSLSACVALRVICFIALESSLLDAGDLVVDSGAFVTVEAYMCVRTTYDWEERWSRVL